MNVWGVARRCHQRAVGASEDGGADAEDVAGDQRVWQRARERCIAVNSGDADQIGVVIRDHQGEDVIVPWVAIDDHRGALCRCGHGRTLAHLWLPLPDEAQRPCRPERPQHQNGLEEEAHPPSSVGV